jgi:muramoyltetrapeptide carboxypeptidase LdcA involved in peptidoglycan recycling
MQKITLGVAVTSLYIKLNQKILTSAIKKFEEYFEVKLFLPSTKPDRFGSVSVDERVKLINEAAKECEVVLSLAGGFNQIELLYRFNELKFSKNNIFVGQSDNTILANALARSNKCKVLYGKGFYAMAINKDLTKKRAESLYQSVIKLKNNNNLELSGKPLQRVSALGILIGGNNYTFDLLQGTEFCPKFNRPFILFMEGEDILKDSSEVWIDFIRNIDSVLLQKGASENIRGLILGKFPETIKLKPADYRKFIEDRSALKNIPIIKDYECGHNKESSKYLPIGEEVSIKC